jgi:hypothetical protein
VDADKVAMHHPAIADALMAGRLGQDTRKCDVSARSESGLAAASGPGGRKGEKYRSELYRLYLSIYKSGR